LPSIKQFLAGVPTLCQFSFSSFVKFFFVYMNSKLPGETDEVETILSEILSSFFFTVLCLYDQLKNHLVKEIARKKSSIKHFV